MRLGQVAGLRAMRRRTWGDPIGIVFIRSGNNSTGGQTVSTIEIIPQCQRQAL
jgi:hypothetical protein